MPTMCIDVAPDCFDIQRSLATETKIAATFCRPPLLSLLEVLDSRDHTVLIDPVQGVIRDGQRRLINHFSFDEILRIAW